MQRRLSALFLVVSTLIVLLVGSSERVEAGACARPPGAVVAVVPADTDVIPRGEGILVELASSSPRSIGPAGEAALGVDASGVFEIGARLEHDGARPIALRVEHLGPAVARLVPAAAPAPGRWRVVGPGGSVTLEFGTTPAAPLPALPSLASVQTSTTTYSGPRGSESSTATVVQLSGSITPPGWQGLVVYQAYDATHEGAVLNSALSGGGASFDVYRTPGRCGFSMPGQSPPATGQLVRVAAYDLYGRLSPRSQQVRVR
ncbi:MAG: hypothetical protein K1X94_20470 [Sandaracinaceae bacterium]|nr:hypothetical protein [Sandaracinaceae bacterium]